MRELGGAASCLGRPFIGKYLLHIDKVKKNSVGCWLMSLRKLFLCYENMSYPYGTYYVPGIDESVKHILVYLMRLTTHEVGTFLIPSF